jgi:hypothetical protein
MNQITFADTCSREDQILKDIRHHFVVANVAHLGGETYSLSSTSPLLSNVDQR